MRQQVLAWLADNVPAARIQHILGVEQMAVELAQHYEVNAEKASLAGLMHDLAKYFKPKLLLEMVSAEGKVLDPVERANPHLLHADASAIVANKQFGVTDEEVLQAIRDHTLGRPGMSLLSCLVFLADSLEVGRGNTPELEFLREICWQNPYQAVGMTCDYCLKYLINTRCLIHPRAILTRNWAIQVSNQQQQGSGGVWEQGSRGAGEQGSRGEVKVGKGEDGEIFSI